MFKYVLKRLGLSVIVLLGVSLIIYTLVRLMPNDYLETKFSAQLQQGTITHDEIDEFKKKYGLYMPDAYLDLEFAAHVDGESVNFVFNKDAKVKKHDQAVKGTATFAELYSGTYKIDGSSLVLEITQSDAKDAEEGTFRILDKSAGDAKTVMTGRFTSNENGLKMQTATEDFEADMTYTVATFWNKAGAVLGGYFSWLGNMLKGDLGRSFLYEDDVASVIADHMWISFFISLVALVFQFAIAIPLGITSATHQYSIADYSVTIITMIGISLPSFFFAALLIKIFSSWLGWFPAFGLVTGGASATGITYLLDMLHHLVLPMIVLVVLSIGGLMRYTRTNMLEVLNSDYIRTARSKGLSEKKVIYVHAFRNTMIPLMTLLAGILPSLFGGAMITEEVFAIDGIGRLAYKALQNGDVPFIMGYNMFLAVLTVIGTLLSDLMYAVVDPRVKLAK